MKGTLSEFAAYTVLSIPVLHRRDVSRINARKAMIFLFIFFLQIYCKNLIITGKNYFCNLYHFIRSRFFSKIYIIVFFYGKFQNPLFYDKYILNKGIGKS